MRFLFVAPLLGLERAPAPAAPVQRDAIRMRSTDSSHLTDLEQSWTPLPPSASEPRGERVHVEAAYLVTAALGAAVIGLLDVADADTRSKRDLDELLVEAARDALERARGALLGRPGTPSLEWVQRILITTDAEVAQRWTSRAGSVRTVPLHGWDGSSDSDALWLGWGDNALVGTLAEVGPGDVLLEGLVDAQLTWASGVEMEHLTSAATRPLLAAPAKGHGRAAFARAQSTLEDVARDALRLHLAVDDWKSNAQGLRRRIAEALLESWGFDGLMARLDQRSEMVATLMANRKARLDRRYQTVVQAVLGIVGAVTLLDLALSLVATALTNVEGVIGDWEFGLLSLVRAAGADVVVTVGLLLFVAAGFLAVRANGAPDRA